VRLINLETSITASDDHWPEKGINYRMHPENVACLTAARVDVCGLANNHVLDYGYRGLADTLDTLARVGLKAAGAGRNLAEAETPALVILPGGASVAVFAFGTQSSGVPAEWAAREHTPGIDLLKDLSEATAGEVGRRVARVKAPRRLVVASIHWGANWGYDVPRDHVRFAHWLIDRGVDVVHGHSSHHPRPIEVYHNRLILYGCGDFIDDYEGIAGHEQYRDDLVLMYFATLADDTGGLIGLQLSPMRIRNMRLNRPADAEVEWLRNTLDRVSAPYGARVEAGSAGTLRLRWG
jgi:poly-gamma-glutamate synthesis protein (capsule biosynthesis protein)